MSISGFTCFKASLGNTIAWYTREIRFPAGPAYYYGLPGLILQVYAPDRNWLITAVDVKAGAPIIVFPRKLKAIRPAGL